PGLRSTKNATAVGIKPTISSGTVGRANTKPSISRNKPATHAAVALDCTGRMLVFTVAAGLPAGFLADRAD
ncbi:MAG: hypothetical protein WAN51_12385, partial [Alphaproteobacteria bacterium]